MIIIFIKYLRLGPPSDAEHRKGGTLHLAFRTIAINPPQKAPSSWKVFINFETKIRGLIRLWCREIRSFERLVKEPIIRYERRWTPWSIIWKSSLIMTIIRCPFITWHFLNTLCQIRLLIATELLCNYLQHSIIVYILLYERKGVVCSKSSKSNDIWFWRKIH